MRVRLLYNTEGEGAAQDGEGAATSTEEGGTGAEGSGGDNGTPAAFDPATWDGKSESVPETHRAFYDKIQSNARKDFDPVQSMRKLVEQVTEQRQQVQEEEIPDTEDRTQADIDRIVNERVQAATTQTTRERFLSDLDQFLSKPGNIGDGHNVMFQSQEETEGYYNYIKEVLSKGLTPAQFYMLYNRDKILADTGEYAARKREEELRKLGKIPKATSKTTTEKKPLEGVKEEEMTVEDYFKQNNPEEYGALKAGKKAFGS